MQRPTFQRASAFLNTYRKNKTRVIEGTCKKTDEDEVKQLLRQKLELQHTLERIMCELRVLSARTRFRQKQIMEYEQWLSLKHNVYLVASTNEPARRHLHVTFLS